MAAAADDKGASSPAGAGGAGGTSVARGRDSEEGELSIVVPGSGGAAGAGGAGGPASASPPRTLDLCLLAGWQGGVALATLPVGEPGYQPGSDASPPVGDAFVAQDELSRQILPYVDDDFLERVLESDDFATGESEAAQKQMVQDLVVCGRRDGAYEVDVTSEGGADAGVRWTTRCGAHLVLASVEVDGSVSDLCTFTPGSGALPEPLDLTAVPCTDAESVWGVVHEALTKLTTPGCGPTLRESVASRVAGVLDAPNAADRAAEARAFRAAQDADDVTEEIDRFVAFAKHFADTGGRDVVPLHGSVSKALRNILVALRVAGLPPPDTALTGHGTVWLRWPAVKGVHHELTATLLGPVVAMPHGVCVSVVEEAHLFAVYVDLLMYGGSRPASYLPIAVYDAVVARIGSKLKAAVSCGVPLLTVMSCACAAAAAGALSEIVTTPAQPAVLAQVRSLMNGKGEWGDSALDGLSAGFQLRAAAARGSVCSVIHIDNFVTPQEAASVRDELSVADVRSLLVSVLDASMRCTVLDAVAVPTVVPQVWAGPMVPLPRLGRAPARVPWPQDWHEVRVTALVSDADLHPVRCATAAREAGAHVDALRTRVLGVKRSFLVRAMTGSEFLAEEALRRDNRKFGEATAMAGAQSPDTRQYHQRCSRWASNLCDHLDETGFLKDAYLEKRAGGVLVRGNSAPPVIILVLSWWQDLHTTVVLAAKSSLELSFGESVSERANASFQEARCSQRCAFRE